MAYDAYEKRIVAFADILGWANATNDRSNFECLLATITSIEHYARNFSADLKNTLKTTPGVAESAIEEHSGIEFSYFSDCFAVSVPLTHAGAIFKILSWATDLLLHKQFSVRGGVTIGELYHKQGLIFGPAMVQAVDIEKNAEYPRLLCSDALIKYLDCYDYKQDVVLQDCNHDWIVNTACGSSHAQDELMKIIEKQLHTSERIIKKWRYIQRMLPKMYDAKGVNKA